MMRLLRVSLIYFFILSFFIPVHAQLDDKTEILFINSYDPEMVFSKEELAGFSHEIRDSFPDSIIRVEYMDTKYISDPKHILNLYSIYKHKYQNTTFDPIITSDDSAFAFVKQYRQDLFPSSPVIFMGVNEYSPDMIEGIPDITGVIQDFDTQNTLLTALAFFPETKNIVIIHDQTDTGLSTRKHLDATLPEIKKTSLFTI